MTGRRLGAAIVAVSFLLLAGGMVALAWLAVGPFALILPVAAGVLYGAARLDNHTGSCLMVTILGLIVLAVLAILMVVLAMIAMRHS